MKWVVEEGSGPGRSLQVTKGQAGQSLGEQREGASGPRLAARQGAGLCVACGPLAGPGWDRVPRRPCPSHVLFKSMLVSLSDLSPHHQVVYYDNAPLISHERFVNNCLIFSAGLILCCCLSFFLNSSAESGKPSRHRFPCGRSISPRASFLSRPFPAPPAHLWPGTVCPGNSFSFSPL